MRTVLLIGSPRLAGWAQIGAASVKGHARCPYPYHPSHQEFRPAVV